MSELEKQQQEGRFELTEVKTVVLVGIFPSGKDQKECLDSLEELSALSTTYGFTVQEKVACPIKKLNAATYIGKGKVEEIANLMASENIDAVIFDEEISPNQQKNIEMIVSKPVLDRTELILEVFAQRAKTKEACLQIELAKIRYQMPRLKRLWTHLSREKTAGGTASGTMRGAGEKQIEVDRRILKQRLSALEKEIKVVRKQRSIQRQSRLRRSTPTFGIVGYTNAGKSTLLNALTQAEVLVEDKLFATLDTTSRKYTLPNHQNIVLVDTVGFIKKLPHTLVAAFKSTLEESTHTDILLHVIDVSHPNVLQHAEVTKAVLEELGAGKKPMLTILNKIDVCKNQEVLDQLRLMYPKTVRVSALNKMGFDDLFHLMMEEISNLRKVVKLRIPQSHYALASELMREGNVLFSDYDENDILMEIEIASNLEHKVRPFYDSNQDEESLL